MKEPGRLKHSSTEEAGKGVLLVVTDDAISICYCLFTVILACTLYLQPALV